MYQSDKNLGFITELIGAAGSLIGSGGSGSGAAGGSGPVTVSPQISTQISPQISPVFQQQFQPSNSAATAGTAQTLPGMPPVGAAPSANGLIPVNAPGYYPAGAPVAPAVPEWEKYIPYALGGAALLIGYKLFAKRKKAA